MSNDIGKNIAQRRKELNMTQEELATKMGYKSKSTINKIELGINDIPQTKIVKFADVLGVSPSSLMGWDKIKKDNDVIANIIVKLRTDSEFLDFVSILSNLEKEQIASVKQFLNAFLK